MPLESFSAACSRFQRLFLRLFKYDIALACQKGEHIAIADTLSGLDQLQEKEGDESVTAPITTGKIRSYWS